jgi:hypothetical protein
MITVKTTEELKDLIQRRIKSVGNNCDLNDIDVSQITDMSGMFDGIDFNGNISKWNVSNVTDMSYMFYLSKYGDISKWNVSKVIVMHGMFMHSVFNGNISEWDVSNVIDMTDMFYNSAFNQDITSWKINKDCRFSKDEKNISIKRMMYINKLNQL